MISQITKEFLYDINIAKGNEIPFICTKEKTIAFICPQIVNNEDVHIKRQVLDDMTIKNISTSKLMMIRYG